MGKNMRLCVLLLMCMAVTCLAATDVFAIDMVVKAKTDKPTYKAGETIEITLEVENHSDETVTPDAVSTMQPSKGTNLTYELYRNRMYQYNTITNEYLGYGSLVPVFLGKNGNQSGLYNPPTLTPHSSAKVGFYKKKAVTDSFTNTNWYVLKIKFSGKTAAGKAVSGHAIVTYEVTP